ncbi:MAG: GDP-L-fucose synthase family protein [Bdellovibrionota bacterium]
MSPFNFSDAKKIVVTGGAGFLGRRVVAELMAHGARPESILVPRSNKDDLRDLPTCLRVTESADLVMHLAAKVGGIGFNKKFPGQLFFDNATMGINMIEASRRNKVKKIVVAGTICAYPRHTPVPFREEDLWNGYPEETNAPYGVAKKALLVMLDAYRQEYSLNGVFLLPVNLYGPNDNFDLESSHVIPALIRKFVSARDEKAPTVTLWGDGSPTREFLYVDDAARGLVLGAEKYDSSEPVNLGSSEEISIKDLANLIGGKVGFRGKIVWDTSRPNGQERRKLDVSRAKERFEFTSKVSFSEGLDRTIRWWEENRV